MIKYSIVDTPDGRTTHTHTNTHT